MLLLAKTPLLIIPNTWIIGTLGGKKVTATPIQAIAFSPDMIWASQLDYQFKDNIEVQFISKYVDEQFIDNTSSDERKLDAYLVHHARLIWDIESELFKLARLSLQVNNLLDEKYVNNAWVYRFKSDGYDPRPDDPYVTANSEGGYDMAGYFSSS